LSKEERTLGNSILQRGAAAGAIVTPFVVLGAIALWNSWRPQFWFVGCLGPVWIALWLLIVRNEDLSLNTLPSAYNPEKPSESGGAGSIWDVWRDRRFWVLVLVVVGINATWHFFRAWLPLYLQNGRGVSEETTNFFMSGYFLFTDVGAITAGVLTLRLHTRLGLPVHRSRMTAFLIFSLIVLASIPAAYTGDSNVVMGLFLVMGFGALGVFPNYYSFTQELSTRHQGKVTGMLGFSCWASIFVIQPTVGAYLKSAREALTAAGLQAGLDSRTAELLANQQAYGRVIACAGVLPLLTFLALLLFWRTPKQG
jgi:ACS family hexuronate transporter-like MFS transporter